MRKNDRTNIEIKISNKMKLLFFDTETNGLPKRKNAPLSDFPNWPNVVQLAWELGNYEFGIYTRLDSKSFILHVPENMVWDAQSSAIHGINAERSSREGTPGTIVLDAFQAAAAQCDILISHNLAFDVPILKCEYLRQHRDISWWPTKSFCTMESTKNLLKLPSRFPKPHDLYKFPKLEELYKYLFPGPHSIQFHSADVDVSCLVQCTKELLLRKIMILE